MSTHVRSTISAFICLSQRSSFTNIYFCLPKMLYAKANNLSQVGTFSWVESVHTCSKKNIRIYHECVGRIEKSVAGSPFGITRLAE